ncbi:MAG TPA: hypothetical protein VLW85_16200 [Myxococcales bacterium]|nr:hypothetical protein [Myxococcales bacterium]
MHLPFGARASRQEQTRILRGALQAVRPDRRAAAFDLDSTLLVNKIRQARIVREWGARNDPRLATCKPESVVSWDLRETTTLCGLSPEESEEIYPALKEFWRERFFTSEYCRDDTPVSGARDYLRAVLRQRGEILYITGRHEEMGPGTLASFARAGFPMPDGRDVQLWLKPKLADDDDAWKEICHRRLAEMRQLACAFDNEPTHVNAYKRSFPDAFVVHLDTDHSRRPVPVLDSIPSVHDFVMEEPDLPATDGARTRGALEDPPA